jgi:hypothetical protein
MLVQLNEYNSHCKDNTYRPSHCQSLSVLMMKEIVVSIQLLHMLISK